MYLKIRENIKVWEIVKGMIEGKYIEGQIFQNADMGDIIIANGDLIWMLSWSDEDKPFIIAVNDDSDWIAL